MKITFLGTSAGMPDADRHCSCTMIEVGERIYFVDTGAPMTDAIRQHAIDPSRIKAIFHTHCHSDHTVGLLQLLDTCTWFYRMITDFDFYVTEQVIADTMMPCVSAMEEGREFPIERLRPHVAHAGEVYNDGVLKATYIPTHHCDPHPSYAILLEAEGKTILFSGDLSKNLEKNDFPTVASERELDLFVCEMAHFPPEVLAPHFATCRAKQVRINHFCPPEKIEQTAAVAKEQGYPFPIVFARDNDTVEID